MSMPLLENDWSVANQRCLMAELGVIRELLRRHAEGRHEDGNELPDFTDAQESLRQAQEEMSAPSAFQRLCRTFSLSRFEGDVLLMCAAVEFDSGFAALCAEAQGDSSRNYPTFSLALAALREAHWSALAPAGSLRHWRMIELGTGNSLTTTPLRIDERILHFLAGIPYLDERLMGIVEPIQLPDELAPSHRVLANRISAAWSQAAGRAVLPAIQLCGETDATREIAAAACTVLGISLSVMKFAFIPTNPTDLDALVRLWDREAALNPGALLIECDEGEAPDTIRQTGLAQLLERIAGPLIVASRERAPTSRRTAIALDVAKPTSSEQRSIWHRNLGDLSVRFNGHVDRLVAQFHLTRPAIEAVCGEAIIADSDDAELWNACRVHARPKIEHLAQRINAVAKWDDLVVPDLQQETLREIAAHVRHRSTVYEDWGFAASCSRGLGISALFVGSSGTGKTMAAEVLATELQLDLYRIDLSAVVSKYIGETEKNLRRVFDAADEGGAILLFDEADALFGKRSEVKDSHDRYANIEVSYLLQRMESYRGLAILTTNMKNSLDAAFLRRIRFNVQFPFPDEAQRAAIWRRVFPTTAPTHELDFSKLARLNVAGGQIRNIAVNAAFLAAGAQESVRMSHLLRAVRSEFAKLEKPLTESEIGDWT